MMSNGLLFYGLQVRTTGTTEGILAFVDGRAGGAAYHPAEASWFPTPPKALLTGWLADERAHGRLASGLEVHTWQCAGGTDLGALDLSALGLVHVPHAVAP